MDKRLFFSSLFFVVLLSISVLAGNFLFTGKVFFNESGDLIDEPAVFVGDIGYPDSSGMIESYNRGFTGDVTFKSDKGVDRVLVINDGLVVDVYDALPPYWWNNKWSHRQALHVDEHSGFDLSSYSILLSIPFSEGMNHDFSDLRFLDATNRFELSYWVEDYWYDEREDYGLAKVWVNFPSLSASSSTPFFMYYGNPSAGSQSSGDGVFLFFDDQSSNKGYSYSCSGSGSCKYTPSGWVLDSGSSYRQNELFVSNVPDSDLGLEISFDIVGESQYLNPAWAGLLFRDSSQNQRLIPLWRYATAEHSLSSGSSSVSTSGTSNYLTVKKNAVLRYHELSSSSYVLDMLLAGEKLLSLSLSSVPFSSSDKIGFVTRDGSGIFSNFKIRPFVNPEPSYVFDSFETLPD